MSITRKIFMGREISNGLGIMKMKMMNDIAAQVLDTVVTIEGIKSPRQLVQSLSGGQA
jgi:simple sugar transport system ATP-binding protein